MKTPTQSEIADFRAFCRNASLVQLFNIEAKERDAGRLAYADVAREERESRERGR